MRYRLLVFVALAGLISGLPLLRSQQSKNDVPSASGPIVADHKAVAEFDRIPAQWLAAAKRLALYYGGSSHGSQLVYGALAMKKVDPTFNLAVERWNIPTAEPAATVRVNYYAGLEANGYWSTPEGIERTRAAARSGAYSHSMFSWCGEQSSNTAETVQKYLDTLDGFEKEFPKMRFIYMTGHAEYVDQWSRSRLPQNNKMVREYVLAHNKVLFDFYDIDTHDPSGKSHPDATDACTWCDSWCKAHPGDCKDLTTSEWPGECAHSHPLQCRMKARAFWWMMARLAGWDGK